MTRRPRSKHQQRLRAEQRRDVIRQEIALAAELRNKVNRELKACMSNGWVDVQPLIQKSSLNALIDVLASSGVIDRTQFEIRRYEIILESLAVHIVPPGSEELSKEEKSVGTGN